MNNPHLDRRQSIAVLFVASQHLVAATALRYQKGQLCGLIDAYFGILHINLSMI